jgi:hypothetical protein
MKMRWAAPILAGLVLLAGWALWPLPLKPFLHPPPPLLLPTPARDDPRILAIVIPRGAAQKIAAGEKIAPFPSEITLTAGVKDTLLILNEDEAGHGVGPFWINAGQSLTLRFDTPGTYSVACSLDPEHAFRIVVLKPPPPG